MESIVVDPQSPLPQGLDQLTFFGHFIPVSRVSLDTSSSSILSGVWSGGELSFPVNLRIAGRHSPGLIQGEALQREGWREIRNPGPRGGTIEETQSYLIDNEHADLLLEVIVHHTDERARRGYVCARCLLGWRFVQVDPAMRLLEESRIVYKGILDRFDANSGKLLVEVTHVTVNFVTGLIEDDESSIEELPDTLDF
ncbi:hypothetical protein PSHT_14924 [Puccinia striiformis]|uniref:Uncharacterized protein n=1 Tax=Puccinia striiformis TaxID=27350 RepID=A0A2S4UHY7_9BASI|nr:hypothetical protein PSHT_14924 [Puccinia striiformis]